ncbi:MAG: molecular chaperone TorD family protein [Chloroflexota bacterium]|nr:molecular chaperone TorD family protein [Chloroflexota bacterium]
MEQPQPQSLNELREAVYRLLAVGFRYPTPEALARLAAGLESLRQAATLTPACAIANGCALLERFATNAAALDGDSVLLELGVEYCRLFVGPYRLPCPPYGSVYLDGGVVMGPSTVATLDIYASEGWQPSSCLAEPADHVAVELEFMAEMCAAAQRAAMVGDEAELARSLETQRSFLAEHLGRWEQAFAARVKAATTSGLYRSLAEVLEAWIPLDQDVLSAQVLALEGHG